MPKTSNYHLFQNPYNRLLDQLSASPYKKEKFFKELACCDGFLSDDQEEEYELLKLMGAPLIDQDGWIALKTAQTSFEEQRFCFVDIESNGSNPSRDQIIELGAILYEKGQIIDRFQSFVFCSHLPEKISSLTHIVLDDLVNAPTLCDVLRQFRDFLGDAVFVAHNVAFDFDFLNAMFFRCSMGWLCNRRLCTIALARKTIMATHYNLANLNRILEINTPILHRAYEDAWTALHVFKKALENVTDSVHTTEELISFSKISPKRFHSIPANDLMLG